MLWSRVVQPVSRAGAPLVRRFSAVGRLGSTTRWLFTKKVAVPMPFVLGGAYAGCFVLQDYFGSADDFFEGTFVTEKEPDAVAEFYQAEDLLKIIAVHPILFDLFMNKVEPQVEPSTEDTALLSVEETRMRVKLLGMEASFEIIEREEEDDEGEVHIASFNRHERFIDYAPLLCEIGFKILLWDQTWNFGFNRLDDGRLQVYHRGERFHGPWIIRMIVFLHQRYVLWGCQKFINSESFGTDDLDKQQEMLACIPLATFQDFVAKLCRESEKHLEAKRNSADADLESIASARATLEKLRALSSNSDSGVAVAKRSMLRASTGGRGVGGESMKLVVGDPATQDALQAVLKESRGNRAINNAMHELVHSPNLEFETRSDAKQKGLRIASTRSTRGRSLDANSSVADGAEGGFRR